MSPCGYGVAQVVLAPGVEPYEPGKSEIKRRFTVEHIFRAGAYKVMFRLKRRDRSLAAATVNIQVRPGVRDIGGA